MRFKVGDTVKCTHSQVDFKLFEGQTYEVASIFNDYIGIKGIDGGKSLFSINRFVHHEADSLQDIVPPKKISFSFDDYSKDARKTMGKNHSIEYLLIGLLSEAGEIGDEFKKVYEGKSSKVDKELLKKELGDALWYLNAIAVRSGIRLEDVAMENLVKVFSRKETKRFKDKLKKIENKIKGD